MNKELIKIFASVGASLGASTCARKVMKNLVSNVACNDTTKLQKVTTEVGKFVIVAAASDMAAKWAAKKVDDICTGIQAGRIVKTAVTQVTRILSLKTEELVTLPDGFMTSYVNDIANSAGLQEVDARKKFYGLYEFADELDAWLKDAKECLSLGLQMPACDIAIDINAMLKSSDTPYGAELKIVGEE